MPRLQFLSLLKGLVRAGKVNPQQHPGVNYGVADWDS